MATETTSDIDNIALFTTLDNYPWDEDEEFQGGLRAILGSVQDPQQVEHLTLRAKCYYYARKANTKVDFDGYCKWVDKHQRGDNGEHTQDTLAEANLLAAEAISPSGGGIADAPKPASFAEICDMIAEGKPIPGIKDIPDTILEGQSSESQASRRKKPWEKESIAQDTPSWLT